MEWFWVLFKIVLGLQIFGSFLGLALFALMFWVFWKTTKKFLGGIK